jgi:hypothetical protein
MTASVNQLPSSNVHIIPPPPTPTPGLKYVFLAVTDVQNNVVMVSDAALTGCDPVSEKTGCTFLEKRKYYASNSATFSQSSLFKNVTTACKVRGYGIKKSINKN